MRFLIYPWVVEDITTSLSVNVLIRFQRNFHAEKTYVAFLF